MNGQILPPVGRLEYRGLDVMKFLMALCVVLIRVQSFCSPWTVGPAVHYVISLAVPFFFITSGFLLGKKIERDEFELYVIKNYARRIWRMYFTWIAIYVPLCAVSYIIDPPADPLPKFIFVQVRSIFMFGEVRLSFPTWYLFSLAIAASALYFIRKRGLNSVWLIVAGGAGVCVLYLTHRLSSGQTVANLSQSFFRITAGMLYVTVGLYAKDYLETFGRSWLPAVTALVLSLFLVSMNMPFWELTGSFAVFAVALRFTSLQARHRSLFLYLRGQSMWIYLVHMYVLAAIYYTCAYAWPPYVFWACACAASVAVSALLMALAKTPAGAFLKKLT